MKRRLFGLVLLATAVVCGADSWTLSQPQVWSRNGKAAISIERHSNDTFEVRHTGDQDWAVRGFPRLTVKPGDIFRMSCTADVLPDSPGAAPFELSVIVYNAGGEPLDWSYGAGAGVPGNQLRTAFAVPAGGAFIDARIVGHGASGARFSKVMISRDGNILSEGATSCTDVSVASDALEMTVHGKDGTLSVTDRRTGRTWAPVRASSSGRVFVTGLTRVPGQNTIRLACVDPETLDKTEASFTIEASSPELEVTLSRTGAMNRSFNFPVSFASSSGDRLIIPMNEGMSYPVEEEPGGVGRLIAYGGHGICMAFFGVQRDADGSGWMAILETPDDAALRTVRNPADGYWTMGPSWEPQKKQFGYPRKIRYVFLDRGGYVAMCKRYRAYSKKTGLFKSFSEKVKERPNVDRLLGAVNVWCWDQVNALKIVKEMRDVGIRRILWSGGGNTANVRAMAQDPEMLISRYDVYQDIYHPDQLAKLGRKSGTNTEAWPQDIMWSGPSSNQWLHAWGVQAKDGTWTWCATMCDKVAPDYERRNVSKELLTKPYNTRFIDTTVASPWKECWNPAHPMTRTDSKFWKMELLRVLGDEFKLVVGSETGHDASVRFCDFYEGMLSVGPYRVPDSGRRIQDIWTNVPPRTLTYQVGERYRLPLWELVYHDCVCAHWYWGDYNNKLPALWEKRDLFNALYGTMGMFMFNLHQWHENRDRFARSYKMTSPIARATGYSEMTDHRILSPDRSVQQSVFANGTVVTVNFGTAPFTLPDGRIIPPAGVLTP